jgi:serine protease Do
VNVPEIWSTDKFGNAAAEGKTTNILFLGGSVTIQADDQSTLDETVKRRLAAHKKNKDNDHEYQYKETDGAVAGEKAKVISVTNKTKKAPYRSTEYMLRKNGITYTITAKINDAVRTDENMKWMNAVLASIKILTK